jgi:transcriptional regulator GlxA family with amidase domain
MQIAILMFDGYTALDAIGPYDVLSRLPDAEVLWVAAEPGAKSTEQPYPVKIVAEHPLDAAPHPDIVVVPGGFGVDEAGRDERVIEWLLKAHETSRWTTSVCTGSMILATAGLLDGKRAATHWAWRDKLRDLGAEPVPERVVREGKIVTAAGVSSGIDMALELVAEEAGPEYAQGVQLSIEYDPQPPFDAGSPEKAPPEIVELTRQVLQSRASARDAARAPS